MAKPTTNDRINFNLRPAKRVERKLVVEALSVIYRYDTPRRFGYVGMGSYYFSDFVLFHRVFGLDEMFSIEIDVDNQERFEFNKPFDCIEMIWGSTSETLPVLSVLDERPVICWLDYFDSLTDSIVGDVQTILRRAQPGSAILLTLNCKPIGDLEKLKAYRSKLSSDLRRLSKDELLTEGKKGLATFMTEVLGAVLESTMVDLNAARPKEEVLELRQLVNMMYQDGDPMLTLGWLLLNPAQATKLDAEPHALGAPGIVLAGKSMNEVIAPILTFREISHLKSILPKGRKTKDFNKHLRGVPVEAATQFARIYRYFPAFADIEE